MNRYEKEQRKKRQKLLANLNTEQIEFFEAIEELRDILNRFESKFHVTMFPEEYDFMYDDSVDYKARKRGENPMQESYQQKVNERRQKLGLEPLEDNGMVRYDDSIRYTKDKVNRLLTSEDQTLKAEIKELIDVEFNFKRFMEQLKAYDVDQFMADKRKEMAKRFGKENI